MKGFIPHLYRNAHPTPWKYMEASAIGNCSVGLALKVASGALAKASGEDKPEFISMYQGTVAAGDVIPVIAVDESQEFKTEFSVAATAVTVGAKVTLDTTGTMVTATTDNGVAEVVQMLGTAAGDSVVVRFPA